MRYRRFDIAEKLWDLCLKLFNRFSYLEKFLKLGHGGRFDGNFLRGKDDRMRTVVVVDQEPRLIESGQPGCLRWSSHCQTIAQFARENRGPAAPELEANPLAEELEQFLQAERHEGRVDSAGTFTLDTAMALQKLAKHTLPRESAWVLRIAQAAVSGKAESLVVRVNRKNVGMELSGLPETFDLEEFCRILTDPTAATPPFKAHLAEALRYVGISQKRYVLIQLFGGLKNPWVKIREGGQMERSDFLDQGEILKAQRIQLYFGAPVQGWGARIARLFGGGGWFVDEERELRGCCYLSPIALRVDSSEISNFIKTEARLAAGGPEPFFWGGAAPSPETLPPFGLEKLWRDWAHQMQKPGDYRKARKMALSGIDHDPLGCLWCFSFDFENGRRLPSAVHWLRDGVVVDSWPIEEMKGLSLGLHLHVSSDGLPTDLSGWKLRADESEVRERYRVALAQVLKSVPQASESLGRWDFSGLSQDACRNELVALTRRLL